MKGQEVVVVREVMEGVLAPALARSILLGALDRLGDPPEGPLEWMTFVQTTLRDEIQTRVGGAESAEIVDQVSGILRSIAPSEPAPPPREREETSRFDRRSGPARVLVAASSSRLARILKVALGSDVVTMGIRNMRSFDEIVHDFRPGLFVVDLTDPAEIEIGALAASLHQVPEQTIVLVWDEGTEQGRTVSETLAARDRRVAWVDRREGVDPLLDHIRASRALQTF